MSLDYLLNLRDGLSGPASKMTAAVRGLQQGLGAVVVAAYMAGDGLTIAARKMDIGSKMSAGLSSGVKVLSGALLGLAAAGGAAAVGLGAALVKATAFRESSITRLSALLGSQERGNREFIDAIKIAERTPFEPEDVVNALAKLSTTFKNDDQRRELFGAASDFANIVGGGDKQVMERAIKALTDVAGKRNLEMEELKSQLADAGLGLDQTLPQIAKLIGVQEKDAGKAADQVRAAIKAGKVSGEQGVYAIYQAMKAAAGGGLAGSATEAGSGTITGLLSNIRGGLSTLLLKADTTKWPVMIALKGILKDVADLFVTTGKEGSAMTGILKGLGDIAVPLFEEMKGDLASLKNLLTSNTSDSAAWKDGLAKGLLVVYQLGKGVFWLGGMFIRLLAASSDAGATVVQWGLDFSEWLSGLPQRALDAGAAVVQGLVNGITNGLGVVRDAVSNLGSAAIDGLSRRLRIGSPSKEMALLGAFSALGFVEGLAGPDVRGAAEDVAAQAAAGMGGDVRGRAAGAGASLRSAVVGGAPVINFTMGDVVSAASDPAAVASEVRAQLGAEFLDQVDAALQRLRQS